MNITTLFDETANEGLNQTLNGTINDETYIPYVERPETYIVPVLFFLIVIVGVLGNGTLVVIFVRHRNMRNVPNTYILSLALADLLISETAKDISTAVSIFTLTALSADRFFAIVDPLKKFHASGGGKRATRVTLCTAFSIWILAIVCAIPAAIGSHIKRNSCRKCSVFRLLSISRTLVERQVSPSDGDGQVPVILHSTFGYHWDIYLSMAAALMLSAKNMPGELQGMQRQVNEGKEESSCDGVIFVVVFAIFFAPLHAFMLFFYFNPDSLRLYNAFWHYLRIVGFCLYYSHSCANPIALYFVSGAFRKYYKR
nr:unnamed protein product [Callosobruchus analis]